MLEATFTIAVYQDGHQIPVISMHDTKYRDMGNLSQGNLSKSSGVRHEIDQIRMVINSELTTYSFGGDDWCIVKVNKDISTVMSGFDYFKPFEIQTADILDLLIRWSNFLEFYEQGKIPGLKP